MTNHVKRTRKARLAALEAKLKELRAWRAQVAKQNPDLLTGAVKQAKASQGGAQVVQEDIAAKKGEEPAPPGSRLVLGDLRHSLQLHRDSL